MKDIFHTVFKKIILMWLVISVATSYAANNKVVPNEFNLKSKGRLYVRPSDLVREKSGNSLLYHFITDYPHPHVPTNNYIKPWDVVASKSIKVKNTDASSRRILKKNNILVLAKTSKE